MIVARYRQISKMENNYFYTKFQKKTNSELERILNAPKSYTEDAVKAATRVALPEIVALPERILKLLWRKLTMELS